MPAASQPPQTQQDLYAALRTRMIQSGEYSRIMDAVRTKLDESGWEDQVRDAAREKARSQDPPNLHLLVRDLEPTALNMVPQDARAEIEAMVREFVEKSVE
ncbi:enhancerof yellow 2 [Rhodotorula toruloides]|uniref:Transcription and mRNA export factor SUS1 n=1 Tax=Rhodotorula toruloides TaxID=5286 RepID=A0A511K779_RHOTO|nr:enhancerof yellow 2 [Rhodotorula toruloides]